MRENLIDDTKSKFADQLTYPSRLASDFVFQYLESTLSKLFQVELKYKS